MSPSALRWDCISISSCSSVTCYSMSSVTLSFTYILKFKDSNLCFQFNKAHGCIYFVKFFCLSLVINRQSILVQNQLFILSTSAHLLSQVYLSMYEEMFSIRHESEGSQQYWGWDKFIANTQTFYTLSETVYDGSCQLKNNWSCQDTVLVRPWTLTWKAHIACLSRKLDNDNSIIPCSLYYLIPSVFIRITNFLVISKLY